MVGLEERLCRLYYLIVYDLEEELHTSQIARLHVVNEPLQLVNHVAAIARLMTQPRVPPER